MHEWANSSICRLVILPLNPLAAESPRKVPVRALPEALLLPGHIRGSMASWLRKSRPIWAALDFSAAYGCRAKAASTGLATFPSQGNKTLYFRSSEPRQLGRTIWASAGQLKGVPDETASDAKLKTSKRSPRTLSGWQRFLKDEYKEREELKNELKGSTSPKIDTATATRDIAAKWKSLSDKAKKPYLDAASASKQPSTKTKRLTGYSLFVKENFESVKARNPTIRPKEVLVNMGHEWRSMSDANKEKYKKRAVEYNEAV